MKNLAFLLVLLTSFSALAGSGPLETPVLKEGQRVYSIPSGFLPKEISARALVNLEKTSAELHYPVLVVLVESIPNLTSGMLAETRASRYTETGDDLKAAYAIDRLAADWISSGSPLYDPSKATIMLLSSNPRKFRLLSGTDWQVKFGLKTNRGLDPFIQKFASYVKGTPKDPATGMAESMKMLDTFLFDNADPGRLAEREAAAAKAAEQARFNSALGLLMVQTKALDSALLEAPRYLPNEDLGPHKKLSLFAHDAMKGELSDFTQATLKLKPAVEYLQAGINAAKAKESAERNLAMLGTGVVIVFLVLLFGLSYRRFLDVQSLRAAAASLIRSWKGKIQNAEGRYVDFQESREKVMSLRNSSGKTREIFDQTTENIDNLALALYALKMQTLRAEELAAKGGFFNRKALVKAVAMFTESFTIETKDVDEANLFGSPNKNLRDTMKGFENSLQSQFSQCLVSLKELKEIADASRMSAAAAFPHTGLDALLKTCEENGIPRTWLSSHPLYGDDKADSDFYTRMDNLRLEDPKGYKVQMTSSRRLEEELSKNLKVICEAKNKLADMKKNISGLTGDGVLAPEDDPRVTLSKAFTAEARVDAIIANSGDLRNLTTLLPEIESLYSKARNQTAEANSAKNLAEKTAGEAIERSLQARKSQTAATGTLTAVQGLHKDVSSVNRNILSGEKFLKDGEREVGDANSLMLEKRYVEAQRGYQKAKNSFKSAEDSYADAVTCGRRLEEARARCHKMSQDLDLNSIRSAAESKIRKFGGTPNLPPVRIPDLRGVQDFEAIISDLDSQRRHWENQAIQVQRSYEEEQARVRAAEERRQRAIRDAEEAAERAAYAAEAAARAAAESSRRSSYYHSSSSSSSSSSDSSSSWDSGSSSGGSDSSSDSGSSSGGCDW